MSRNYTKHSTSTGPYMQARSTLGALEFNIANMRLAQHQIGSAAWRKSFWRNVENIGYRNLECIFGDDGDASSLRSAIESKEHLSKMRVERATAKLLECPRQNVSFVTVVTGIAHTKDEALAMLRSTGDQLDRFIRRRFTNAMWLMLPEVDIVLARDIADGLVVHSGWRKGVPEDRRVYKVHFHGVIYTPGMNRQQVEQAFRFGRNGKRLKQFSGHNQVRAKEMHANTDGSPDVEGIKGYATKFHYRPPVKSRMLEGAAEWVWLTHHILTDAGLIKIGGVNGRRKADTQSVPSGVHENAVANSGFENGTRSNHVLSVSSEEVSVSDSRVQLLDTIKYLDSDPVSVEKIYDICGKVKKIRRLGTTLRGMEKQRRTPRIPGAP